MKRFLQILAVEGVFFLAIIMLFLVTIDCIGLSDHAYKRVVSKTDGSLIVGTSRAAQALQPAIMDDALGRNGFLPFYNFAFTIIDSPFGDMYYEAIMRKMAGKKSFDTNRLFIICVDPFSLSMIKEMDENGLRENKGVLKGIPFFHRPNLIYLFRNFKLLEWNENKGTLFLHDDGWLEVSVSMDSLVVANNVANKLETYKGYSATPSTYRMEGLIKTIRYFQTHGSVFLCRLSTCMGMNEIEHEFWPDFDVEMKSLAADFKIQYFSFVNDYDKYRTIDGNHIYKEDGVLISKALCDSILLSAAIPVLEGETNETN